MKSLLESLIVKLLTLAARAAAPMLQSRIAQVVTRFVGDVPRLGNAWVVEFIDPSPTCGAEAKAIDARLEQYGCFIFGTGHIQGQPGDPFQYHGIVRRQVLYGAFRRKDHNSVAGTGSFVVKINADASQMYGQCSWFDKNLDAVWGSEYFWRQSK